ncbi:MAG: aminotransferase class V-fold PLP-dependent enzyme [Lysobacterales bacterium]|nr:MAG: aminotransferase class V-fold PLP-dependent enzyme [Xanthomonadales bacterium]
MPTSDRPPRAGRPLHELFPILEQGHYLNHAAIAPWPLPVAEAVRQFAEENLRRGPRDYSAWIRREQSLRRQLAELVGAALPDDITLLKNTTEGISLVAWGLDWRAGDNLVLPRGEFASNRLPWLAQAGRGVVVREVDIRGVGNRNGRDPEAALIAAMDRGTRLLSVSAVQWSDGFRLDLGRLGEACHERGVLFFVDAIQQLGALRLSVEDCRVDFLAADAHKWLLGPEGIAVFFSRPKARERLTLLQQGWHMFEDPWHFQRDDWAPAASGKRFEAGSPNSLGQAALHAAAGLLLERGMRAVEARILENTRHLVTRLGQLPGVRLVSHGDPARQSGIVSFASDRTPARELHGRLAARDVSCALRGDAIRLSPHFYQGEAELEAFLQELEGIL